jgi:hypothetical protein
MDDRRSQFPCGCLAIAFIVPLVGFALRADEAKQFWVMAGIYALVWVLGLFTIYNLIESSHLQKLFGSGAFILALAGLIAVGSFLLTGRYENSLKFVSWLWLWSRADQVEPVAKTESVPTEVELVATPVSPVNDSRSAGVGLEHWERLMDARLSHDQVLDGLNEIWSEAPEDASLIADAFGQAELATLPEPNRQAIDLLAAVALERAGSIQKAYAFYKQVADRNPQDPYAASANVRLHFVKPTTVKPGKEPNVWTNWRDQINANSVKQEAFIAQQYSSILHEPERSGWFLISDQWAWSTSLQSTIQVLSSAGSGQFSYEVLRFLRSISPLQPQDSFIFVLLVLAVGLKVLELPLYVRNTRLAEYMRRDDLPVRYSILADPQSRRTMLINVYSITIVELIFIMWLLNAVQQSTVQWAVDGARFFWVEDVTQRNLWILVAWVCLYASSWLLTGEQRSMAQVQYGVADLSCNQVLRSLSWLLYLGIFLAFVGWQQNLPAATFIVWSVLLIAGVLLTLVLRTTWRTVIHLKYR